MNIWNYRFFQRLLSAFHNCSRSLLHLLNNSGSYQWPAQAQAFWLRNHDFFHSMNHVLGFGFQQCSLRRSRSWLSANSLLKGWGASAVTWKNCRRCKYPTVAERSACSETPILQELEHQATTCSQKRKQNLSQATWSGSNNLAHTYLLLVAVELQHQEQLMSEIWGRVRKSCESPISKTRNTPFQSLLVNLIDWLPQMPGGKHQCFMILRSLSAAKAPATCKSHDMTHVQSISWFGVNSKLKSHLNRTTAQEVGLCIPRLPISSGIWAGTSCQKWNNLHWTMRKSNKLKPKCSQFLSPAQSVGSLTAHRDKVPFDRSLGCALGPPEVHSWPAGSVLQLWFRKTCTISFI